MGGGNGESFSGRDHHIRALHREPCEVTVVEANLVNTLVMGEPDFADQSGDEEPRGATGTPSHQLTVVEQPTRLRDPKSEREQNFETHYRSV